MSIQLPSPGLAGRRLSHHSDPIEPVAEGFTNIYIDAGNSEVREQFMNFLDGIGIGDVDIQFDIFKKIKELAATCGRAYLDAKTSEISFDSFGMQT